ncbi:signal transduction histidine kinase [Clostridiales Family XIII bacterium PM5-7]
MKRSITKRLVLYFTCTLLAFAVIIGLTFTAIFTNTMTQHNKSDLQKRANTIATTLSTFLDDNILSFGEQGLGNGQGQGRGGFGAFLKFVDDIAMGEVWLVDKDTQLITKGQQSTEIAQNSLPPEGIQLIQSALQGEIGFGESFSEAIGQKSITVCVPCYGSDGTVLGAVLLHAPVEGMQESVQSGLGTLAFSVAVAFILSALIAILLSSRFIRMIKKIGNAAKKLADGDYGLKTKIQQEDEIGELAKIMDILSERLLVAKNQHTQLEIERQMFYADISHELRTPVTVMRGSLEALRDGKVKDEEKRQEYYSQMISETEYMQNMVNDLLDFSKLKNPEYPLEIVPLNFSDILSDVIRSIRRISEEKNVRIAFENSHATKIQGDYEKLRQMFLIVLDNAVKFSPNGEVISVNSSKKNGQVTISICDKGKGISEADLPHIFDRFYKDKSEQNSTGSGIGLAIAKQIADRHGIEINVSSHVNKGTCFEFVMTCI